MPTQQISISTPLKFGKLQAGLDGGRQLANLLEAVLTGAITGRVLAGCDDTALTASTDSICGQAVGLLSLSGGAGTLTVSAATVQQASVVWATSDSATCKAIAAAIASTALYCTATSKLAKVTVGAGVTDGETVTVNGIIFTRKGASPALTSREFANASDLAKAINLSHGLAGNVRACANATTGVYVGSLRAPGADAITLGAIGANITVNASSPVETDTVVMVMARQACILGNLLTLGVTGTGLTIAQVMAQGSGNYTSFDAGVANSAVIV